MPSPFPGMNPYIEQDDAWHDFHERFLPVAAERIGPQVVPGYIVKIDEHVDLLERLAFIEIRDRRSRALVTVIELLSPSNKPPGPDRDQYLARRGQILASPAHLVEIDLLRGGAPMPADDRTDCDYAVLVSRAEERPHAGFWPIRLRDQLPVVPIPLRAGDPEARLALQEILDHIHDTGGYAYSIYDGAPEPPLRPDDAAWAKAFLPPPQ